MLNKPPPERKSGSAGRFAFFRSDDGGHFSWRRLKYIPVSLLATSLLSLALTLLSVTSGSPAAISGSEIPATKAIESSKLLSVPYAFQGTSSWCFETSLSMVLRYWGKTVSLQNVVSASRHDSTTSNGLMDVFLGWVHPYLSQWPDLTYSHDIRAWDFDQYRAEIDEGTPVIASNFGLPGHTVVVAEYSLENEQRCLYLHDPSGYLTNLRWVMRAAVYAKVSWDQFAQLRWTELSIRRSP